MHLAGFHPIKPSDVRPSGITGNSLEARYPKMRGDSGGHVAGVGGLSAKLLILLAWGPGFEPDIEPLILFTHFAN